MKHPLAKGLVKVEIKTYYEETITRGVSNYQVLLQVIPQGLSTRASFTRPPRSTMVIIRRGLFTQAYPKRPLLLTFEELLVDEELAKEAALKEAIEAANKRMPTLEEATCKAKADVKAGRKGKKKEATRMLPSAVKTSCGVKATIDTTQMEKPKRKRCPACRDQHTGTDADGKVF